MRSDIESLIRKFDDLCGESPTEMGDAALAEEKALRAEIAKLRAALQEIAELNINGEAEDMKYVQAAMYHKARKVAAAALKAGNE
jgi:hypothetical protein